ncbi:unnamed protein product [Rotaria sp. Silwood2]|nr:unnamed protein product [Rotaria sp. Silwood2]CAF2644316.1 unnamed protein product [Rotaria sp. Silwood2]CAF3071164.1 unnamed protein product [Rotaria sp. Silwood2]
MTKVAVDANNYELTEYDSQRVISPTGSNKVDQKSAAYENPVFSDQRPSITNLGNGTIVTTKLEIKNDEEEQDDDDDEDKNNAGFEKLTGDGHKLGLFVLSMHQFLVRTIMKESKVAFNAIKILLVVGFIIFFGFAMSENFGTPAFPIRGNVFYGNQGFALFILVVIGVFFIAWENFLRRLLGRLFKFISRGTGNNPVWIRIHKLWKRFTWVAHVLVFLAVAIYIGLTVTQVRNLVSLIGIFVLIILGTLGSKFPHRVGKIAWIMQKCLNTTAAESMNAAANIFVGMSEAPLLIMPLIPNMTTSELHAVLVGGFATMAGSVLATFILFGVPANHLIAASVMAAPGALGFAKLLLPETHKTKTSWETVQNVPLSGQHNAIDALMTGAGNALKICGYLIANLIAFMSVLNFLDVSISWLFNLVRHPEVNFQYLLGLIFYPFALITGISFRDCLLASKLIGIKVSINEFIAYQELGKIRGLRDALMANNTFPLYLNGTLKLPSDVSMLWDENSVVILTYALCGFANFGSMGIALAALSVFAPTRKRALMEIAPRALIGGNMVSLMTASIAGIDMKI